MLVLSVALPPAFSGIIISSRFQVYTRTGTSSLAACVLGFIAAPCMGLSRQADQQLIEDSEPRRSRVAAHAPR